MTGVLGVAVVAQGAYIVHTRRQVASMAERLESLSDEYGQAAMNGPASRGGWGAAPAADFFDEAPAESGRPLPRLRVPPPNPAAPDPGANGDPLPLPPVLDSADAREQLRQFVVAQMERERQEARVRQQERREEREQERRAQMAKELGLSGPETEKFEKIFSDAQQAREKLRERMQAGELGGPAIREEMISLRAETEQQMRSLLGGERMQKFSEMPGGIGRRGGGRFGGRGPGGPGGPGFGSPGGPGGPGGP